MLSPKINSFSHHFFTTFVVVVVKTTGIDSEGAVLGHCKNSLRANENTFKKSDNDFSCEDRGRP